MSESELFDEAEYALISGTDLESRTSSGWQLKRCMDTEITERVSDDVPSTENERQAWVQTHGSHSLPPTQSINRYVVLREPRFLVQRTPDTERFDELHGRIRELESNGRLSESVARDVEERHVRERKERADRIEELESALARAQHDCGKHLADLDEERGKTRNVQRAVRSLEEDECKLRSALGDELMDKLLNELDTNEAQILRQQVTDALAEIDTGKT
jgi:hypothetical protein